MAGPEGQRISGAGCYLEVVPERRLVWTDALAPGYRPSAEPFFTGMLLLQPEGSGTRYTAIALHRDEATCKQHADMGFHQGWGTVVDQLVAFLKAQ